MWQVSGNTSRQIAKLPLIISTMKAKGSTFLWQTECSWFMTTQILTNGIMLIPKVIQLMMHPGVWMRQIQRRSRSGKLVQLPYGNLKNLGLSKKMWSESKYHKNLFKFCISLVRRKDIRLNNNEKNYWDCSEICTNT